MPYANLSFELPASENAGAASDWLFSCTSQTEAAAFDGGSIETFNSWPNGGISDLAGVPAAFDASNQSVEDFEQEWLSNEFYSYGIAGEAAAFDGASELVEDFEESWSTNEAYAYAYVGVGTDLAAAAFDGTPEAFEDFEENWSTNESYKYTYTGVGTDLTAASFDSTPEAYEDFEEDWPTLTMTSV